MSLLQNSDVCRVSRVILISSYEKVLKVAGSMQVVMLFEVKNE